MTTRPVRVRYAPSPTGDPHVGNVRSALFNWLFARHSGGSFMVRIEDTDQERRVEGAEEAILESLRWLGLDWDEGPDADGPFGPYVQSQRVDLYQDAARRLIESDNAYYCTCSTERLNVLRESQQRRNLPTGYDRRCRNLSPEEHAAEESKAGDARVVRFKVPLTGKTTFNDYVRGDVTWENRLIDDFVILKSDGFPTYHLANVVDDQAMEISHVLRADEWLASTPRHVLLYQSFGWTPPVFAHLPLILGADRSKLSKRDGAVSLLQYRDQGFLPEAMLNFLALLGWSLDDKTTIIHRDELIASFSLERIVASPAVFDRDKLGWINGVYIREMSVDAFTQAALPFLERELPSEVSRPLDWTQAVQACLLVQDRARTLKEVPKLVDFFFTEEVSFPAVLVWAGMGDKEIKRRADAGEELAALPLPEAAGEVRRWLTEAAERLAGLASWEHEALEQLCRALVEELETNTRRLFGAMRVAVTGRTAAPPLFVTMETLGRDRVVNRLRAAASLLTA